MNKPELKIIEMAKTELDPNKHYIIKIKNEIPKEQLVRYARLFLDVLHRTGINNVCIVPSDVEFEIIED